MLLMSLEWDNACKVCNTDKVPESRSAQWMKKKKKKIIVIVLVTLLFIVVKVTHDIFNKNWTICILLNSILLKC